MYFDSHCHLTDRRLHADLEEVLDRARKAGVGEMVSIASGAEDAGRVARLVEDREGVWGTAGVHPHVAEEARPGDLDRIRDLLLAEPNLVAVGEAGLDYHYDNSPRKTQRRVFRRQAELAAELDLPLVVHSRDADEDTRSLLEEVGEEVKGVLHCFTGGDELLKTGIEAGWYVSFSGIASFDGFGGEEAVRSVPPDRLLVETDAPYLAPVPRRGRRNEPAFVRHVVEAVARIRGEEPEAVARTTRENARRFYGLNLLREDGSVVPELRAPEPGSGTGDRDP